MFPPMLGICALCKQTEDLQNSHIISEFLYGPLYDHIHRFHVVSADATERERHLQKGLREHLLCKNCEQRLGRWENYTKSAFIEGKGVQITKCRQAIAFSGLDYRAFKLFQLSLLWRMSVTTLDFFKEVDLGPHEERIRLALLNETPLSPGEYACHMVAVEVNQKPHFDWITPPCLERLDGHHIYWLVINGILYSFYVGSHAPPSEIAPVLLSANGEMLITVRQLEDIACLHDAALSLAAAHRARAKVA
jgi:hypothetical protein